MAALKTTILAKTAAKVRTGRRLRTTRKQFMGRRQLNRTRHLFRPLAAADISGQLKIHFPASFLISRQGWPTVLHRAQRN